MDLKNFAVSNRCPWSPGYVSIPNTFLKHSKANGVTWEKIYKCIDEDGFNINNEIHFIINTTSRQQY